MDILFVSSEMFPISSIHDCIIDIFFIRESCALCASNEGKEPTTAPHSAHCMNLKLDVVFFIFAVFISKSDDLHLGHFASDILITSWFDFVLYNDPIFRSA